VGVAADHRLNALLCHAKQEQADASGLSDARTRQALQAQQLWRQHAAQQAWGAPAGAGLVGPPLGHMYGGGFCGADPAAKRTQFGVFGMQNREFGPYSITNNRILISATVHSAGIIMEG
jgi:hypothetical protein